MQKLVLFYNPVSGHAAFKNKLDWIVEAFQRRGILLILYRTKKEGNEDFVDFLQEVKPDGVLAAGGDGTVHECVNLLVKNQLDLPLGIIGSGTSNDFATYLKINEDMEDYFDKIAAGNVRRMDVGRVGEQYFINVASAGMMTCIAHEVDRRLKNALGKMAYYLKVSIAAGKMAIAVAVGSPTVALTALRDTKNVAKDIAVDDGMLDLLAIKKCSIPQLMSITADLVAGRPVAEKDGVLHLQAKTFQVAAVEKMQSDLDGEVGPLLPLTIETIPQAIAVYC